MKMPTNDYADSRNSHRQSIAEAERAARRFRRSCNAIDVAVFAQRPRSHRIDSRVAPRTARIHTCLAFAHQSDNTDDRPYRTA